MKLFRGIRQSLIKEGNLKKYLLYAVGEILLVMIGISLAFQVSNWDDNRIKKNAESKYYESTRTQIADDSHIILEQIHFNNRYFAEFKYVNEIIENNDRSKMDTLGLLIRNLTQYSDFDKQGNIYETMVNSGQINLLQNDKIVNGIRELEEMYIYINRIRNLTQYSDFDKQGNIYETMVNSGQINLLQNDEIVNGIRELEEMYIYINRMESIHYDAMMNYTGPVLASVLKFSTLEIKKPDDVFNYEFQNIVISLIQVMEEKDRTYNQARNKIVLILKSIDEELKD